MRLICKRCLIDTDAFVREHIIKQLADIAQEDKVTDGEHEKRLLVCDSCQHLMGATCSRCGSFAEVRSAKKNAQCPDNLW